MAGKGKKKEFILENVIRESLNFKYYETAIPCVYQPGETNIFVATGLNASGKSFFSSLFGAYVKKYYDVEAMVVGMRLRTGGGMGSMMFGNESHFSTGYISVGNIFSGFNTAQQRQNEHVLVFDEPDVGLAEPLQGAMGLKFAEFGMDLPQNTKAMGVVSHSRRLLSKLLPLKPHHIRFGDSMTLEEFIQTEPEDLPIEALSALQEEGRNRFRAIQGILNKSK